MAGLDDEVQFLRGVGPQRAADFNRLGILSVRDLVFTFPRDLRDRTRVSTVADAPEDADIAVAVTLGPIKQRTSYKGKGYIRVEAHDDTGYMEALWFNAPWMADKLRGHKRVLFYGRGRRTSGWLSMMNPNIEFLDAAGSAGADDAGGEPGIFGAGSATEGESSGGVASLHVGRLVPEYPCTGRLTQGVWRKVMDLALREALPELEEFYPEEYLAKRRFPDRREAVRGMHFPEDGEAGKRARTRLAWDEALLMQLSVLAARRHLLHDRPGRSFAVTNEIDTRIRRLFPFRFTEAQNRAVTEIAEDMRSPMPMHRLLQGDVGSGKTAVALYAMLAAIANGCQACVMAPTGLLARQHYGTIQSLLGNSERNRVRTALLAGGLKASERADVLDGLRTGSVDLLVATHAAVSEAVAFRDLGLVVIDEQHKFGVRQRATLLDKGVRPDALVMTATPIPRSLALTVFGDLDVSVIDSLPPGRKGVATQIVGVEQAASAWDAIRAELRNGRQAYVVCPRLKEAAEEDEEDAENAGADAAADAGDADADPRDALLDEAEAGEAPLAGSDALWLDGSLASAETAFEVLRRTELSGYRVGLVHGQMRRDEQEAVMKEFRAGRLDVLVGTVVVEVGVDVPNATAMAVLHAERFGLAQLHQLRGRVGRGAEAGKFFLFSEARGEEAARRLSALAQTSDGFKIAETDLELRGPGEFLGTRQHGVAGLKLLDLVHDLALIRQARAEAGLLLAADPDLTGKTHVALRRELVRQHGPQWSRAALG